MTKELFIKSIEAIQEQIKYDISVSKNLSNAFPESSTANLLPKNDYLLNALIEVLQVETNDTKERWGGDSISMIEYFCWELNFGKENWRLKVTENGTNIPLSNAGELYDYLTNHTHFNKK